MKRTLSLFAVLVGAFSACTADYDALGTSDYRSLENVSFVEQDGPASVYSGEHRMVFTLRAPPDSVGTWDSITVKDLETSHFASLHLVDSKFREFPTDSAALDSLARQVSFERKSIRKNRRLRLPQSQVLYAIVVSESGKQSLWKWSFEIPGVAPDTDKDSPDTSSTVELSSAKSLSVEFENQVRIDTLGDTLQVKLASGMSLDSVRLKGWSASDRASVFPSPDSVRAWKDSQSFTVTAEDGSERTWTVRFAFAGSLEILYIAAKDQLAAEIDDSLCTVTFYFESEESLQAVEIDSLRLSDGASSDIPSTLDLTEERSFDISDGDSSKTWTLRGKVKSWPPQILSLRIENRSATIDTAERRIYLDTLPYLADLSKLEISQVEFSKGASSEELLAGSEIDLESERSIVVKNATGDSATYRILAGYQLPNSGFDSWNGDAPTPDSIWNNANTILTTTKKYSSGSIIGAEIKTGEVLGKVASGSLYTADFNPNGVGTLSMAKASTWPDGNELLDFGKPFRARPRFMEVKFQYNGQGNDSCDIYIILENRTGNRNVDRSIADVNKLVASAWFRSTTSLADGRTCASDAARSANPDVVSVSDPDANGFRVLRLKLQYGTPLVCSPIENSSVFATALKSSDSKAIFNGVEQGTGNEPVTHIRVVFASSAAGNSYSGVKNSTLLVDEMRLLY